MFKERGITYRVTWEGDGGGWRGGEGGVQIGHAGQDAKQAIDAVNIQEVAGSLTAGRRPNRIILYNIRKNFCVKFYVTDINSIHLHFCVYTLYAWGITQTSQSVTEVQNVKNGGKRKRHASVRLA